MSFEQIRLAVHGQVAAITLNRPDALNAITTVMLGELAEALDQLSAAPGVRVVVLTGEGRAFSAGVDLKALGDLPLTNGKVGDVLDLPARAVIERIAAIDAIVIAKVNGFCFTGALELALACDLVIVAAEARLGDTHAKWGLRPTWGMSQRLSAAIGPARARLLSYTGQTFTGLEAATWGLAAQSFPRAELDEAIDALSATIAGNSPGALRAYKDLYQAADRLALPDGLAYEAASDYPITDTDERVAEFR
jgi:enoyl-CoA hydratase